MKQIVNRYLLKFDEIERLGDSFNKSFPESYEQLEEIFTDALYDGYLEGFASVGYSLKDDINRTVDTSTVFDVIAANVAGKTLFERLKEHYEANDAESIKTLLFTEYHRLYNEGGFDRAVFVGGDIVKTWYTVGDVKVRETHNHLNGVSVALFGEFVTFDGDSARLPGLFKNVKNNANCRCIVIYEFRSARNAI